MASNLHCPNCDEDLGKDTQLPTKVGCGNCGQTGIDNPRGDDDEEDEVEIPPYIHMEDDEFREFVNSLKVGEWVIETSLTCQHGMKGEIYVPDTGPAKGCKCVLWEPFPGDTGRMGTSVTSGTRRLETP